MRWGLAALLAAMATGCGHSGGDDSPPDADPGDEPARAVRCGTDDPSASAQYTDLSGDGRTDLVVLSSDGTFWVSPSTGAGFLTPTAWLQVDGIAPDQVRYADVDGDRRDDLLIHELEGRFVVARSTGAEFDDPSEWLRDAGPLVSAQVQYADVDGDGRVDLAMQRADNSFWISLSTGTRFEPPQRWLQHAGEFAPGRAHYVDVDADGRADLVLQGEDNAFLVSRSTGTGFDEPSQWLRHDGRFVAGQAQYADLDGDRRLDVAFQRDDNSFWVSLSTGAGFASPVMWRQHDGAFVAGQAQYADVDADGKADLLFQDMDNRVVVSVSTGSAFRDPAEWIRHAGHFTDATARYADLDADGRCDLSFEDAARAFRVSLSSGVAFSPARIWLRHGTNLPGSLTVRAVGPDGNPLARAGSIVVSEMSYRPVGVFGAPAAEKTFGPLPGRPLMLQVPLDVPGYGSLLFTATNEGLGYLAQGQTLDVLYEVARHRHAETRRLRDEAVGEGLSFPPEVDQQLDAARTELDAAAAAPPGSAAQAASALRSLESSTHASATVVTLAAFQRLDRQGGLRPDQIVSTFALYEGRAGSGDSWRALMDPAFTGAVQNWHWQVAMQPDGSFDWTFGDASERWELGGTVDRLTAMGKVVRGHSLLWLSWLPDWMRAPSFDQLRDTMVAWTAALVARYPQIRIWNIANETANSWSLLHREYNPANNVADGADLDLSPAQLAELVRAVADETRRINPDAIRGINSVLLWGEDAAAHLGQTPAVITPYEFYEVLARAGVDYEYIGMQIYFQGWDLFEVDQMLDRYQLLGKRIRICETDTASAPAPASPPPTPMPPLTTRAFPAGHPGQLYFTWYAPWDESRQASWLEGMLAVSLSKAYVDEWNWWELTDAEPDLYYPSGGLSSTDYAPKQSYLRLVERMQGWAN